MRKGTLHIVVAVCTLIGWTPRAEASGVNLRWDACLADGGTANRSFACDLNSGAVTLVPSFVLGTPLPRVSRVTSTLQLASASPVLPEWWNVNTCRIGAIVAASPLNVLSFNCVDWTNLQGNAGVTGFVVGERGSNTARLEVAGQIGFGTGTGSADLDGTTEYLTSPLRISIIKSTGANACSGCSVGMCIVLGRIEVASRTLPTVVLSQAASGPGGNFVTWQGGAGVSVGAAVGCPAATPAREHTWGAVKALYR
mgnify:CR=1 FL=1